MPGTTYELLYWPAWLVWADVARLVLAFGKADFKQVFITFEDFPAIKQEQRFGKIPRLTVRSPDGNVRYIWESRSINEYLAATFGFLPREEFARADIMSYVHSLNEISDAMGNISLFADLDARRAHWYKLRDSTIPEALAYHERALATKTTDGPFYTGRNVTLPDIVLYAQVQRMRSMFPDADQRFLGLTNPRLAALIKAGDGGKSGATVREWIDSPNPRFVSLRFDMQSMNWVVG